jgi:hypothetical protein
MLLRDHPLIRYRGVHMWPPVWTRTDGLANRCPAVYCRLSRTFFLAPWSGPVSAPSRFHFGLFLSCPSRVNLLSPIVKTRSDQKIMLLTFSHKGK